jgi:hypothetical protein
MKHGVRAFFALSVKLLLAGLFLNWHIAYASGVAPVGSAVHITRAEIHVDERVQGFLPPPVMLNAANLGEQWQEINLPNAKKRDFSGPVPVLNDPNGAPYKRQHERLYILFFITSIAGYGVLQGDCLRRSQNGSHRRPRIFPFPIAAGYSGRP